MAACKYSLDAILSVRSTTRGHNKKRHGLSSLLGIAADPLAVHAPASPNSPHKATPTDSYFEAKPKENVVIRGQRAQDFTPTQWLRLLSFWAKAAIASTSPEAPSALYQGCRW